jgi:hypothetical protein
MSYWYIIEQTGDSISLVYLTTSRKKCKARYDELSAPGENVSEEEFDIDQYGLYYMGYFNSKKLLEVIK